MSKTDRGLFDSFSHLTLPLVTQQVWQAEEGRRRNKWVGGTLWWAEEEGRLLRDALRCTDAAGKATN